MNQIERLKVKYPRSIVWSFGDTPDMADTLADLVVKGIKTASCCSLSSFMSENEVPTIGSYSIILNSTGTPVCVVRTISLKIIRFSEVTDSFARKEGEGDLSLSDWKEEHRVFFEREGSYSESMELVAEESELIKVLQNSLI